MANLQRTSVAEVVTFLTSDHTAVMTVAVVKMTAGTTPA